jgi:uncharacterized damage-inducible protein DinB
MNQLTLFALARYNAYANQVLLSTAAELSLEELRETPSPSRGSILRLIQHLFATEAAFLAQCQGKTFKFEREKLATIAQLQGFARQLEADLLGLVSSASEDDPAQVRQIEIGGHPFRFPVWQILVQVFMHSAQHRGELSILLSELGHPLPISDIIVQFAGQSGQPWPWK